MQSRFTVGDTFEQTTSLPDYPAGAGWVLKYRLLPRDAAGAAIDLTCVASGDDHVANATAAATAGWKAGSYTWSSWVELGGVKHSIAQGQITLAPDPRVFSGVLDGRSQAEIALANIRSVLAGVASKNVLRYEIGGRSLEHYQIAELIKLESKLAQDVKREQNAAGMNSGRPSRRQIFGRVARA